MAVQELVVKVVQVIVQVEGLGVVLEQVENLPYLFVL